MFAYCLEVLNFSEDVACNRIAVARAARRFPVLLAALRCGAVHLSGLRLIAQSEPTRENVSELLEAAKHKSKREIEKLLADRKPRPDAPDRLQRVPMPLSGAASEPVPDPGAVQDPAGQRSAPPAAVPATRPPEPLGQGRFKVQFMLCEEGEVTLREVRALLRHQIPNGDLGQIFERALKLLYTQARKQRFAHTDKPRTPREPKGKPSRHLPAEIRRVVEKRDQGCCTYISKGGRRCKARDFLQFHHLDNWARSKRHSVDRIVLRCWGHNQHAARQDFGESWMAQFSTRPGTGGRKSLGHAAPAGAAVGAPPPATGP